MPSFLDSAFRMVLISRAALVASALVLLSSPSPSAASPSLRRAAHERRWAEPPAAAAAADGELDADGVADGLVDVACDQGADLDDAEIAVSLIQRSARLRGASNVEASSLAAEEGDEERPSLELRSLVDLDGVAPGGALNASALSAAAKELAGRGRWVLLSSEGRTTLTDGVQQWWHEDVFHSGRRTLKPNEYLTRAAPGDEWLVLGAAVLLFVLFELVIFRRWKDSVRNNLFIVSFWVLIGVAYNIYFAARYGRTAGIEWCTGYLLEWMLSIDNMFVFVLIFKFYHCPEHLMRKALFCGIFGGVVCRIGVFMALGTLLNVVQWVRIVFGLILIYSGIQAVADEGGDEDVADTYFVKFLSKLLGPRLLKSYDAEGTLFPKDRSGRRCVSMLFFLILILEVTDIVFAVDSVSAKVAQLSNQYIAYSSSVLAMFGLRAAFFVVKDMLDYFDLLKYGLCIILVFIGVELIAAPFLHLESATVCIVIASVFAVSLTASTAKKIFTDKASPLESGGSPGRTGNRWNGSGGPGAYEAS